MTVTVRIGDPRAEEAVALLTQSHTLMLSLFPAEDCYFLDIDELCVPSIRFFIAEDTNALGCIALANKGVYGEVKSMFVDPAGRGKGVGEALVARLIADANAQGLSALKLETGDGLDAAHRLYARHGFTVCGPFGDYVEGPHSIFMEKAL